MVRGLDDRSNGFVSPCLVVAFHPFGALDHTWHIGLTILHVWWGGKDVVVVKAWAAPVGELCLPYIRLHFYKKKHFSL